MSVGPQLVREKTHHSKLQVQAHQRPIRCVFVLPAHFSGGAPRVYTAGEDQVLRLWDGKTGSLLAQSSQITRYKITALSSSGNYIYLGTEGGEVLHMTDDCGLRGKFQAHNKEVTCIQAVNQGRVFTGSLDCSVKMFSSDGEVIRQFPLKPADCREPILSLRVITGNLLFTGSADGTIRVYNMRQELIRSLRTRDLMGIPLEHMQLVVAQNKISIICAYETRITMWYLTLVNDEFGDSSVDVDAVKSLPTRIPSGRISAMRLVYINPLKTNRPCVYLGTTSGILHVIVPLGKGGTAINNQGIRVYAPKFKEYAFKDANAPILSIYAGSGKVYAGTAAGTLYMWREALAMLQLRKFNFGMPDTHAYVTSRHYSSVLVEAEPTNQNPMPSSSQIESFGKMIDADINEDDFNEPLELENITLSSAASSRGSRASTTSSRASTNYGQGSGTSSSNYSSSLASNSSTYGSGASNSRTRTSTYDPAASRPPGGSRALLTSKRPTPAERALKAEEEFNRSQLLGRGASTSSISRNSQVTEIPIPYNSSASAASSLNTMGLDPDTALIVQLLYDSAAGLDTLPEPNPYASSLASSVSDQMSRLSIQPAGSTSSQPPLMSSTGFSNTASSPYLSPLQSFQPQPSYSQPSASVSLSSMGMGSQYPSTSVQPQASAAPLQSREDQEREALCTVCLDSPKNAALYTCGHVCVCFSCGKELMKRKLPCPLCRAPIQDCIQVYK